MHTYANKETQVGKRVGITNDAKRNRVKEGKECVRERIRWGTTIRGEVRGQTPTVVRTGVQADGARQCHMADLAAHDDLSDGPVRRPVNRQQQWPHLRRMLDTEAETGERRNVARLTPHNPSPRSAGCWGRSWPAPASRCSGTRAHPAPGGCPRWSRRTKGRSGCPS